MASTCEKRTCCLGKMPDGSRCHDCVRVRTFLGDDDVRFWGTCDHGVSLAPWVDCAECEVREDDADA